MSKYKEFKERFQKSGLTQKAFGLKEGITGPTVHYYLKRAQEEERQGIFSPIEISSKKEDDEDKYIIIKTSSGIEVQIPL